MKQARKFFFATLAVTALAFPIAAAAYNDALMTLRFHGGRAIAYQDQLFYVVREAVKTKSTVVFDVVSTAPSGRPNTYGQRVASDIARIGVNPAQITYRAEQNPGVQSEEVRIFVR